MKKLFRRKNAVVFTILAVFLSTMFILLLSNGINKNINKSIDLSKTRSLTLSTYHNYLSSYILYSTEMSAKSCLYEITKDMKDNNYFFVDRDDFAKNLKSCMLTAKITRPSMVEVILSNLEDLTLTSLLDQLVVMTEEDYSISTNYDISDIILLDDSLQVSPTKIGIEITLDLNISSDDSFINPGPKSIYLFFDAINVYDPYYGVNIADKNITNVVLIGATEFEDVLLEDFLDDVSHVQLLDVGTSGNSLINKTFNDSTQTDTGLVSFIKSGDIPTSKTTSYVDIYYVSGKTFNCEDMYCFEGSSGMGGACALSSIYIDSHTFWTLQSTYRLNVSNWGKYLYCP